MIDYSINVRYMGNKYALNKLIQKSVEIEKKAPGYSKGDELK
jgi:hypothetical protein